jgi:hypothetical protein
MNEAETRAELIDPALRAAGWGVVADSRVRREERFTLGRIEGAGRRGNPCGREARSDRPISSQSRTAAWTTGSSPVVTRCFGFG